jgi:predicted house-cleaning noncanonical NTP pyrophosphatase (MazG superfamily)
MTAIAPKIVRDNIPQLAKNSRNVGFDKMGDKEFYIALKDKLIEEAKELRSASGEHEIEEFADVCEVLDRLIQLRGKLNSNEIPVNVQTMKKRIQKKQKDKRAYKGGFKKNFYMYVTSMIS